MAVTLQNCLDASSYFLGESGTPSSETTKRTLFANEAKKNIRDLRNWSWEKKTSAAQNIVNATTTYTLASDFKNRTAMEWVKITDTNGNVTYYSPIDENGFNFLVVNTLSNTAYWVSGDPIALYTLNINPSPTATVTNGLQYRYYAVENDFALVTDTTKIPKEEAIAWYIAAKVLYGYREQAHYQLAMSEYQNAINDLSMMDQKKDPYVVDRIQNARESLGFSNNFKVYY